ncbi:hypothetical protein [Flavobacterium pallidum]|uniref:GRAM domain-containing protein n=1 Tax=Flavobacterium pallidum TaxID=2172098 RepID=A0A2S1SFN4_9FLAO|nr:hypothetical protein [Flavobacterium pallidum]AWI25226.1 hypothetical protein HYN49_04575 [Flavobacterium pallidum]
MKAPNTLRSPYVTINNDILYIQFKDKSLTLPLDSISKMDIRKRKTSYFPAFMGLMVYVEDRTYKLRINTTDDQRIRIKLRPEDCWHFTAAVKYVRERNNRTAQAS